MIKKYIVNQLTQLSAWTGFTIVLSALFLPRSIIIILGIALILTDDDWCQKKMAEWSPGIKKILQGQE